MNASAAPSVVSKSQYAALKNVSPGRVSQWISEGKIEPDALIGEGRSAKINVAVADRQLKQKLDLSQRLGNGLATRLGETPPPAAAAPQPAAESPAPPPAPSVIDAIEEAFKREKLEGLQRENRKRAEEEAARAGRYVDAQAASAQMAKIATKTITIFEGALPEIAGVVAAKFSLSQRDVLHLLRSEFRSVRQRAAGGLRDAAAQLAPAIEAEMISVVDEPVAA
jgi:hypothetical protein